MARVRSPQPTHSLADAAYQQLHDAIVTCQLPPGHRFTERGLCDQLGIGKTPLREALTRLISEGLVRSIARVGYEAAPITLADVRDVYGLKLVVEPAAAQLAINRVDIAALRALDRPARRNETTEEFLARNREIHLAIARASRNARLAQNVESLIDASDRIRYFADSLRPAEATITHRHEELIGALERGDPAAAHAAAASQILAAQAQFLESFLLASSLQHVPLQPPLPPPGPLG
jgi:DNA-binding GntR family transcriptional regulator